MTPLENRRFESGWGTGSLRSTAMYAIGPNAKKLNALRCLRRAWLVSKISCLFNRK